MLAYVYDNTRRLVLMEHPEPRASRDSAVIKVNACAICGTDFRTYTKGSTKIQPPRIIGHEVVGTIVELGSDVTGFRLGERVAVTPAIGCGVCYPCRNGYTNMCDNLQTIGFEFDGGFAPYMEIPAQAIRMGNINRLPAWVSDEEGALVEPCACVVNAQEFLQIKEGDYVAVWGSGYIGCIHAELALMSGAARVIMIEPAQQRAAEVASLLPEVIMIDPGKTDTVAQIMELTEGRGIDVGITACSAGAAQEEAQRVAAKRGRISLFGGLVGESKGFIDSNLIHYRELSVYGVHASTATHNRRVIDWLSIGRLSVKKYIKSIYPLAAIEEAMKDIKNGTAIKAIVKP
jgi:L-iditol 2-dehydrogenase